MQNALNSRVGSADNTRFLEQFRYIIIASQLLSGHQYHGRASKGDSQHGESSDNSALTSKIVDPVGAVAAAVVAFGVAWLLYWSASAHDWNGIAFRLAIVVALLAATAFLSQAYLRRRWLRNLRQYNITETTNFVERSHFLDSSMTAALSLIQEVELVSRGYRM